MFWLEDLWITLPSFGGDEKDKTESSVSKLKKLWWKVINQAVSAVTPDVNPIPKILQDIAWEEYEKRVPAFARKFLKDTFEQAKDPQQLANVLKEPKWKTWKWKQQVWIHDPSEKNTELRDTINALKLLPDLWDSKQTEAEEFRKKLWKDESWEQKRDFVNQVIIPKSKQRPNEIIMRFDHPEWWNLIGGHMSTITGNKKFDYAPEKSWASWPTSTLSKPWSMSISDWKWADWSTNATHNIVHVSDSDKSIINNNLKKWIALHPETDKKDFEDAQKWIYKLWKENCAHMNAFIFNWTEAWEMLNLDKPWDITSPIRMQKALDVAAKVPNLAMDYDRKKIDEHWQQYGWSTWQWSTVQEGISLPEEDSIDFSQFAKRKAQKIWVAENSPNRKSVRHKAQKVWTAKNSPNRKPAIEQAFEWPIEPLVF